jgi:dephospho-CoA kinase
MILGLTGSMGGGKTTAARLFEAEGYLRIDSDALVRDELLTCPAVIREIKTRFSDVIDSETGQVQRSVLADYVFADVLALEWLEAMIHPKLYALWRERIATAPDARWIIEVPLLFEKGLENWFDFTVCVSTSSSHQLARLKERGIPKALAEQRISKQLPLAQKLERADFVLSNDGTPEALQQQVAWLVRSLTRLG